VAAEAQCVDLADRVSKLPTGLVNSTIVLIAAVHESVCGHVRKKPRGIWLSGRSIDCLPQSFLLQSFLLPPFSPAVARRRS
jgi:hypothetical protein